MATKKTTTTTTTKSPAKAVAKATAPKVAPEKKVATTAKTKKVQRQISNEERINLIQVAAFYIAERRGFSPGNEQQDWINAEREIDEMITSGKFDC